MGFVGNVYKISKVNINRPITTKKTGLHGTTVSMVTTGLIKLPYMHYNGHSFVNFLYCFVKCFSTYPESGPLLPHIQSGVCTDLFRTQWPIKGKLGLKRGPLKTIT